MTGRNGRAHHQGTYAKRAAAIRNAANTNPDTVCWRCGRGAIEGDPWQAGHTTPGEVNGELKAEHRSCNASHGATHGNQMREPQSEPWY